MSKITKPLKWHGGKSKLATWIHSLAPPSVHSDAKNGYTHRGITMFGSGGEFWNWLPFEGISEVCGDSNFEVVNFHSVLANHHKRAEFLTTIAVTPLSENIFRNSEVAAAMYGYHWQREIGLNGASVDAAIAFFIRMRMSRQGLGRDYCTPTRRIRGGMNENVSAWLGAVDGLLDCVERLMRVEFTASDFRELLNRDHDKFLWYIDPPYWGPLRTSWGEYGGYEFQPYDHAACCGNGGRDVEFIPYDALPLEYKSKYIYGLLDILPKLEGKFMLSGYHSRLYDSWAHMHSYKCHEYELPNSSASGSDKDLRVECVWTNY